MRRVVVWGLAVGLASAALVAFAVTAALMACPASARFFSYGYPIVVKKPSPPASAPAVARGGYGRLLAQSTRGYLGFTHLPANLHLFTLAYNGPPGDMTVHGFIDFINPGINIGYTGIRYRPFARSSRTPPGSSNCRAGGDAEVLITRPDKSTTSVAGTIKLYGR